MAADKLVDPKAKPWDDGVGACVEEQRHDAIGGHSSHTFARTAVLFSVRRKRDTRGSPSSRTARLLA